MPNRRVPVCSEACTGKRQPRDGFTIVDGDHCYIRQGDHYLGYSIPDDTKQLLIRFDQGEPAENLERSFTVLPPRA
jgi:hypothetical protein